MKAILEEDDFVEGVIYDKDILETLFEKDFNKAVQGAEELLKDYNIALVAKEVIIEMVFQLGKTGVSKFKKMFDALKNNDYSRAAAEMRISAGLECLAKGFLSLDQCGGYVLHAVYSSACNLLIRSLMSLTVFW